MSAQQQGFPRSEQCLCIHIKENILPYVDAAGEVPEEVIADAFTFLQQQGCINMGVPAGEPDQAQQPAQETEGPSEDDIVRALQAILKNADLQV